MKKGHVIFAVILAGFLMGCGGGGNSSPLDSTPPTIVSITPTDGAAGIEVNNKIAVVFSEVMDASTVNNATFVVSDGSNSIPGTVTCDGTTATFTPSANLSYRTSYTATVTTGGSDTVSVIDATDNTIVATIATEDSPYDMVLNP